MEFDPSHSTVSLGEVIETHEGKMLLAYSSQIEAKGSCNYLIIIKGHCSFIIVWIVFRIQILGLKSNEAVEVEYEVFGVF